MRQHGADSFFEIMTRGLRPLVADRQVTVIDAPPVHLAHAGPLGNKHCRLRCAGGVGHAGQRLVAIQRRVHGDGILLVMGPNHVRGIPRIGIHEPDTHAGGRILRGQALLFQEHIDWRWGNLKPRKTAPLPACLETQDW